ncbi:hypothetical protein [Zavarzinella formosa]|uniref:hypothetical protein n=1 Tax=Zavarzinella formosa TaxID=360055 RepID=UPI00030A30B1|nr:hypothetical protein [Zavarzinella formosa]
MIDGIDSSHWLPRGSSVINACRANKGDLEITVSDGRISNATIKDGSLLGWMVERGILDELHRSYAMILMDMRITFRRQTGYKSNSIYALEFFGGSNSRILETLYLRVCRMIAGPTEQTVIHAMSRNAPETRHDMMAVWDSRHTYLAAFDRLVGALDEVREEEKSILEREAEQLAQLNSCA